MSSKNVKIAQPYAEAFLDLFNKSSLENVINDLNILTSAISGSEEFKTLLSNPLINSDKKKSVIESLFRGKIENRTLNKAASIETVKVTSSIALNSSQQEALISKLKKMTGIDQIKLDLNVNPNLIGGFVIQVGSKIIDTSLQGQLRELSSYLGASVL